MKQYLFILIVVCFVSCSKQHVRGVNYYERVQVALADSMQADDYAKLDFTRAVRTVDADGSYLRIGFAKMELANDFVLLSITDDGAILRGRMIHIEGQFDYPGLYNGFIRAQSLQGDVLFSAPVAEGYVRRTSVLARGQSMLDPYKELPEVVVISQYTSDKDYSYASYYNLHAFLDDAPVNGSSGNYGTADPYAGAGAYTGGGYTGGTMPASPSPVPYEEEALELEAEYVYSLDGIDIQKFFRCFELVPSQGASYSIRISADLPVNNNPGASTPFNVGHSFLTVVKSNGRASVTQSFGFYPKEVPSKTEFLSPLPSELKDNGVQEMNASLSMPLTEGQFQLVKAMAIARSARDYDLANYNCTSFALDVFNAARSVPLTVRSYTVYLPGNPVTIRHSPAALFTQLRDMEKSGHAEAANIKIDLSHNYQAPISKGECN